MKKRILTWSFLAMAAPLSFLAAAEQCLCGPELEYSVSLLERAEHRCQVEMRIRGINHPYLDLSLPAWNNLYQLRNFVENLSQVTASNADGEALEVRRIGSHTWRIKTDSVDSLSLRYRVFANLPGDFYSLIDENHAFLNGANIFLYLERHRGAPLRLEFEDLDPAWRIATDLDQDGFGGSKADLRIGS